MEFSFFKLFRKCDENILRHTGGKAITSFRAIVVAFGLGFEFPSVRNCLPTALVTHWTVVIYLYNISYILYLTVVNRFLNNNSRKYKLDIISIYASIADHTKRTM